MARAARAGPRGATVPHVVGTCPGVPERRRQPGPRRRGTHAHRRVAGEGADARSGGGCVRRHRRAGAEHRAGAAPRDGAAVRTHRREPTAPRQRAAERGERARSGLAVRSLRARAPPLPAGRRPRPHLPRARVVQGHAVRRRGAGVRVPGGAAHARRPVRRLPRRDGALAAALHPGHPRARRCGRGGERRAPRSPRSRPPARSHHDLPQLHRRRRNPARAGPRRRGEDPVHRHRRGGGRGSPSCSRRLPTCAPAGRRSARGSRATRRARGTSRGRRSASPRSASHRGARSWDRSTPSGGRPCSARRTCSRCPLTAKGCRWRCSRRWPRACRWWRAASAASPRSYATA